MNGTRARASVALVVLLAALAGCATRPPDPGEPVAEPPESGRQWVCQSVGAPVPGRTDELDEAWTLRGGAMLSVHRSERVGADSRVIRTQDEATADALAAAATAAMDILEQRGVSYDFQRRDEIVGDAVDAALRGAEPPFPRIRVVEQSWEECVAESKEPAAGADTSWSTSVLVEYPIGFLRGDVNNVAWERARAANEAEVFLASCEEQFSAGRWLAGLLDALKVADIVLATGAPLPGEDDVPRPGEDGGASSTEERLKDVFRLARDAARAAAPLTARAEGDVAVLGAGVPESESVLFHVFYEWDGVSVPAVGVPVNFEMPGASAVLSADPLTDESGVATCRVLVVYGQPGEYEVALSVDTEAARAALGALGPAGPHAIPSDHALQLLKPLAARPVHVVDGGHAVSVCAEFGDRDDADAAQAMDGFSRRMERDGFRMVACGAGTDVVFTGEVSMVVHGGSKSPVVQATLTASAFDQRTAREIGRTSVQARQAVAPDGADESVRAAEILALKEAGRLLAAYFGPRILASGR